MVCAPLLFFLCFPYLKKEKWVFQPTFRIPYIIKFVQPEINRTYLPDLYFPKTDIFVELKGVLTLDDRKKHLWIQQQTDYDVRFCFMNANNKIRKGSKTKYSDWCEANDFIWCEKEVPLDWMK